MSKLQKILFLLTISTLASLAAAGELRYECTITNVYDVDESGLLKVAHWQAQLSGGKFSIARESGEISGQTLTTRFAQKTEVVNGGSEEYSFKAFAEIDEQVQVIEVQEFRSTPFKPFVALSLGGAGLVTGICE